MRRHVVHILDPTTTTIGSRMVDVHCLKPPSWWGVHDVNSVDEVEEGDGNDDGLCGVLRLGGKEWVVHMYGSECCGAEDCDPWKGARESSVTKVAVESERLCVKMRMFDIGRAQVGKAAVADLGDVAGGVAGGGREREFRT